MNKQTQEALKMAIAELSKEEGWMDNVEATINACKEALNIANCDLKKPVAWQGLTNDEIGRLAVFDGLHHVEIPLLAKFILAIEQALKDKNT
jgi:hypothetical protein